MPRAGFCVLRRADGRVLLKEDRGTTNRPCESVLGWTTYTRGSPILGTVMSTYTAHTTVAAAPDEVLGVLTDPDAIERWSPIPFELEELESDRLQSGVTACVSGKLSRFGASFHVEVESARTERFALVARGPIELDVTYELFPTDDDGTEVWVSLDLKSGGGITGRLMTQATDALLRAGALDGALGRIAREIETTHSL